MPSLDELESLKAERKRRAAEDEKDILKAEAARRSFSQFIKCVWPILEPSTPLEWSFYFSAMAEHLEACHRNQIQNLAITIPPGTCKSTVVMEAWPAWLYAQDPGTRVLCGANTDRLATKSSTRCRDILRSDWYQRHFPHVQITDFQDGKSWFGTTAQGFRKLFVVGGAITGERGDWLIIDDPNDAKKVLSKEIRDSVTEWYDTAAWDRVNSLMHSKRVMIAQRTHRLDLIGHVIERHGFEQLMIPEEYEAARTRKTFIGWTDPRTEEGELLRPTRMGPKEVAQAKKLPSYRAKHQQDPTDIENAFYKPHYFQHRWTWSRVKPGHILLDDGTTPYEFDARQTIRFASADAAASAKTSSDNTAVGLFTVSPRGDLIWLDIAVEQLDIPDQPELLGRLYSRWRWSVIAIEAVGSNRAFFQYAQRLLMNPIPMQPTAEKLVNAQAAIIKASQGQIWLPAAGVVPDFDVDALLDELVRFTGVKNNGRDDRCDVLSQSVNVMPLLASASHGASMPRFIDTSRSGHRAPKPATAETPRFNTAGPRVVKRH